MSPPGSTTRRDILSAYVATSTKIASWAAVSAVVYRRLGPDDFALLALIRSTLGLLAYTSLGLGPALIHQFALLKALPALPIGGAPPEAPPPPVLLPYAGPRGKEPRPPRSRASSTYVTGVMTALWVCVFGLIAVIVFRANVNAWLHIPYLQTVAAPSLVTAIGIGIVARLVSDPASAALQTFGRIAMDNYLLALADAAWVALFVVLFQQHRNVAMAGVAFAFANVGLLVLRYTAAQFYLPFTLPANLDVRLALSLLSFGLLVTLAQLADFLYAPTDFLLINHFLSPRDLAAYAPCVQIDAALLVLVTGLSSVLLPKAALAHARNDTAALRRYYVQGTLLSTALLLTAALVTWLAAPLLLRLWLHDIPPGTLRVLPLVLCHTVLGGSSAVGRSILLGSGRVKPFTAAVLVSGLANVALSYALVRYTPLGLTGIVLGTLTAVTLRCALWMPWYTVRVLRGRVVGAGGA